jgi:hypothetical protein
LCYKLSAWACAQCAKIASPWFSVLAMKARPECVYVDQIAFPDNGACHATFGSPATASAG